MRGSDDEGTQPLDFSTMIIFFDKAPANEGSKAGFWNNLFTVLDRVQKIITVSVSISLFLFLSILLYKSLNKNLIIIRPIILQEALVKEGYSADGFAAMLRLSLIKLTKEAQSSKPSFDVNTTEIIPDIKVLNTGISSTYIQTLIDDFIGAGQTSEITGVVSGDIDHLKFRFILTRAGEVRVVESKEPLRGIEAVVLSGAEEIAMQVDPYIVASAYLRSDPRKAERIADQIIFTSNKADYQIQRAWAHILKSAIYYNERRSKEAIKEVDIALTLDQNNTVAFLNRGSALLDLNQKDEALEALNRSVSLNPQYSLAYIALGNALKAEPDPDLDRAIEKYRKAVDADQSSAVAHYALANGLRLRGKDQNEAALEYRRSLALDANDAFAHYGLANVLKSTDLSAAIEHYQRSISLDRTNPTFQRALGQALAEQSAP